MKNRILGLIGMLGAPFLLIDYYIHGNGGGAQYEHTSLSGVFGLIYIFAWICSTIGLWRMKATGNSFFGVAILIALLITLTLASFWNIYEIIKPGAKTILYQVLDMFWPISNLVMLILGVNVLAARQLTGWQRLVPLAAGLWFPVSILVQKLLGNSETNLLVMGNYAAIAWILLGYMVFSYQEPSDEQDKEKEENVIQIALEAEKLKIR
jgi:hypothetical protein